ncbi:hypothetical protein BCR42DRAFT_442331 [Absidia repens]|uniref:F-box domain-containing protein n=1 Tax=Absidia repens TaxID=90262 RepID=A0A1X2I2Z9_9FUNG|nr:hypothetical protein BCR42DRAFT_442331 [Absidia repens]
MRISIDEKLPNEILTQVIDYLPPHSLHVAARVNSRWFQITRVLGVNHLVFPATLRSVNSKTMYVKNQIASATEGARIRHMLILSTSILPDNVFRLIQQLCPNIVSFDYDPHILTTDMKTVANRKRHLFLSANAGWGKSIAHLPACNHAGGMQWKDADLCRRLETFYGHYQSLPLSYWRKTYVNLMLPHLPSLYDLTLHIPFKMRETNIACLDYHCPRLTALTLRDIQLSCVFNRNAYGNRVNKVLATVKTLKLEYIKFLYIRTLDYFPKKFPNVQSLTLFLDDQSFQPLFPQLEPDRKSFQVVRDKVVILISCFKHLTELIVYVKDYQTNESITSQVWPDDWVRFYCDHLTQINQLQHYEINYA